MLKVLSIFNFQASETLQEKGLCKANEEREVEHRTNIEKLKDNLAGQQKHQIEELENEMNKKRRMIPCEKESLTSKQSQLT